VAQLSIDWTRCEARGVCLDLLPDLLRPDDWGYPIARHHSSPLHVSRRTLPDAQAAVRECPRLALRLTPDQ
jgi:ferredoxin